MEGSSVQLNSIVGAHDPDASLDATKQLYVKPFYDSWQTFLSHFCLLSLCVVVLILCAPARMVARECFIERFKRVCTIHVLYEG